MDVLSVLLASALVSAGFVVLYELLRRLIPVSPIRLAAAISTAALMFYSVQVVRELLEIFDIGYGIMISWLAVSLVAVSAAFVLVSTRERLNIMTAFAVVGAIVAYVPVLAGSGAAPKATKDAADTQSESQIASILPGVPTKFTSARDVYYVILDSYAGASSIQKWVGYDNAEFYRTMTDLGYKVFPDARSNYLFTALSIPSMLQMDFPNTGDKWNIQSVQRSSEIMQGDNPVFKTFRNNGYKIVVSGSRFCSWKVDWCISESGGLSRDVRGLFWMTPLPVVFSHISPAFYTRLSNESVYAFDKLWPLIPKIDASPKFVLVHSMELHGGYYDSNCEIAENLAANDLQRAKFEERFVREPELYKSTLICMNKFVVQMSEELRKLNPDAIIVYTADHGTSFSAGTSGGMGDVDPHERFSNFSAWSLPPECGSAVYEGITNINHFRAIFGCLSNQPAKYLPDNSYFMRGLERNQLNREKSFLDGTNG